MPQIAVAQPAGDAVLRARLTGLGTRAALRWGVVGSELGIPYAVDRREVRFLFGDTFGTPWPQTGRESTPAVMLSSHAQPGDIMFDSGRSAGSIASGRAGLGVDGIWEETVLPTDGICLPDGRHVISYVSVSRREGASYRTSYAGLALSNHGTDFRRTSTKWWNNPTQDDPFQLSTMQRDDDWVYVFSVPSGRSTGAMMLRRVRCDRILDPAMYEGWNAHDGTWGRPCTPILRGAFGEPSVRRLIGGCWVMSYLNSTRNHIVTRTATHPTGPWSHEKVQLTPAQEPGLYGGFIHPWSTPDSLHLIVSARHSVAGVSTAYRVSQYIGSA
ncbi:DUF4185 domain-containing protein [Kribbella albertanoniae]|uniref:DUF4185 domain-containing protein n=1 Tax=Kribbella albertanoniae TaxID=1266829 RepID=UPI001EDD9BCE|nr:DUF4185 domain-containing protein [Kribbella albertanoniae]